jgi:hypothetical protein
MSCDRNSLLVQLDPTDAVLVPTVLIRVNHWLTANRQLLRSLIGMWNSMQNTWRVDVKVPQSDGACSDANPPPP